jgi:hypothetical protein
MLHLSNRYTSSDGCHDLAAQQPATRAPVLQAIEDQQEQEEQALNCQINMKVSI